MNKCGVLYVCNAYPEGDYSFCNHFANRNGECLYMRQITADTAVCISHPAQLGFEIDKLKSILPTEDKSRTSCASFEGSATRNTAEEREKQHTTGQG